MIIVGAGFSGSVVARQLAEAGRKVTVYEKRVHIGGNAYDKLDANGVLVHPYGPHIFHTNSDRIFEYLSRFTAWRPYRHVTKAHVDGKLVSFPINLNTLDALGIPPMKLRLGLRSGVRNSESFLLATIGPELCDKFYRGYTLKQWGLTLADLDDTVVARVPVRMTRNDDYFDDKHQVMPADGYTRLFENLLDHPNITVKLGTRCMGDVDWCNEMVWTGPIDEFFEFKLGPLPYRSLKFEHVRFSNYAKYQDAAIVTYPDTNIPFTRVTEFKQLTGQEHPGTSVCWEFPTAEGDPYYPIPRPENHLLYSKYKELAKTVPNVTFVGRLAQYRYYNMDQAVGAALKAAERILDK